MKFFKTFVLNKALNGFYFKGLSAFILLLFLFSQSASAATIVARATGNWNATATWTSGVVPGSGDDVQVPAGYTVTIPAAYTASCLSLKICSNSGNGTTTVILGASTSVLNVANAVTIYPAGNNGNFSYLKVQDGIVSCGQIVTSYASSNSQAVVSILAGTLNVSGNINMTDVATYHSITFSDTGNGKLNLGGSISGGGIAAGTTSTINLNGSSAQTFPSSTTLISGSYYRLKSNNPQGVDISSLIVITHLVIGDVTPLSFLNTNGVLQIITSGSIIINNSSKFITYASNYTAHPTDIYDPGTTIDFRANNPATINLVAGKEFQNLIFSGTGTKTITAPSSTIFTCTGLDVKAPIVFSSNITAIDINGDFKGASSMNSQTRPINISGNWTNTAGGTIAGLVTYDGVGSQIVGGVGYTNVTFTNTGTKTVGAAASVLKLLTVNASTVLDANDNLTLLSTATSNANIGPLFSGADVIGNVSVQSYLTGNTGSGSNMLYRGIRAMSSPINDAAISSGAKTFEQLKLSTIVTGPGGVTNGFDQGGAGQPYAVTLNSYDETKTAVQSAYVAVPNITQAVTPGKGFFTFFRGKQMGSYALNAPKVNPPYTAPEEVTVTYTGPINKFDVGPIALTNSANAGDTYNGYNLAGNPYPSVLDWDLFPKTDISSQIIVIKPGGTQASYTSGASPGTGVSNGGGSRYIQPGQAFYVKANAGGATLLFKENYKSTQTLSTGLLSAPKDIIQMSAGGPASNPQVQDASTRKILRINLEDDKNIDETTIVFESPAKAEAGYEDVNYFSGSSVSLASLSSDDIPLAINFMPDLKEVKELKLYVNSVNSQTVKLNFKYLAEMTGYKILLKDELFPDTLFDVAASPVYQFSIDKTKASTYGYKRFKLLFQADVLPAASLEKTLSFSANRINKTVELNWNTSNNQFADYFEIERSSDGQTFKTIGQVNATANLSGKLSYQYLDAMPADGSNYYRIKQVAPDEAVVLSQVVSVKFENQIVPSSPSIRIFPNPTTDRFEIQFPDNPPADFSIRLINSDGKTMKTEKFSGTYSGNISSDVSDFQAGIYIVEISDNKNSKKVFRSKLIVK